MTSVDSVVTYLELRRGDAPPTDPVPSPSPFDLQRQLPPAAARVAAEMYAAVGGKWQWTDRVAWTAADWAHATDREGVEVWLARVGGEIAGYFQLELGPDAVELKYFGLLPAFAGRGLGRLLLSSAIDRAWALGRDRMTVNTCTLDHPAALPNYRRRGFTVLRTERRQQAIG